MTKSGKRRNPFCKRHGSVWTCPLYLDGRFALGSSATCCSSCTTPTLASSTLLSQASTRASSKFSCIWRRHRSDARDDLHFKIYDTNWKSAEEGPDTVTRLLQEDLDMPSSSRSSTLTSLKLRSVGLKDLQLVASAFQGQKTEIRASVSTAR